MLKLIDKIILLLTAIAATGLLGAYVSAYIDPNVFVFPSLLGLAYPYLLIANLLLFFYWLARWKKTAWGILLVILAGIPAFRTYYGTADTRPSETPVSLSLLSYNVRYFDAYDWSKQKGSKEKMLNYLSRQDADILCLQEFSLPGAKELQAIVKKRLHRFPHHYIYRDLAIFSRFPLLHKTPLQNESKSSASCIYCDVVSETDTIRLYNIHLASYRLGKAERAFIQDLGKGKKREDFSGDVKKLTGRLTQAHKNRARQAGKIRNHLTHSPYPVILCGDFNDTPLSYTYRKIKKDLKDSFIEKGRGLGNTYIGEFPSFRIDYILHSPDFETLSYQRENLDLSDHYPIKTKLGRKK